MGAMAAVLWASVGSVQAGVPWAAGLEFGSVPSPSACNKNDRNIWIQESRLSAFLHSPAGASRSQVRLCVRNPVRYLELLGGSSTGLRCCPSVTLATAQFYMKVIFVGSARFEQVR